MYVEELFSYPAVPMLPYNLDLARTLTIEFKFAENKIKVNIKICIQCDPESRANVVWAASVQKRFEDSTYLL